MIRPTQQEFTQRALACIEKYNQRYVDFPCHQLSFCSCDAEQRRLELTHTIYPDELNVYDTLHGGAMAWLVDSCAGILCRSYMNITACVTTNLTLSYVHHVAANDPIIIAASLANEGRKMLHLTMDIHHRDTGRICCTASASFYVCE